MMDKFEEKILNLKIPEISDKFLEYELKEKLEKRFFYNKFRLPYHVAFGSALVMLVLTVSFVINPNIAHKINLAISGKNIEQIAEVVKSSPLEQEEITPQEFQGFEGLAQLEKQNEQIVNGETVTDENGEIKTIKYLDPDDFEEGKVYMIRKYKSQDQQGMIMINEIENRNSNKGVIRKMWGNGEKNSFSYYSNSIIYL